MYCEHLSRLKWVYAIGEVFLRVSKDCVHFSLPNPTGLMKGAWLCLKPSFIFLFFLTNSLTWNSQHVGVSLDNNNHRKRGLASPYTATSKFSIYIKNSTTFHWLNTFHYYSFAFTSDFINAIWSIYLGKFYFCFQWFIQRFHAALVPYLINKNCLKGIEAINFSSSTVKA